MEKWTNIYGYQDGTIAVYNGQDLMLKHYPDFIGAIDEKHKEELLKWLIEKECKAEVRINIPIFFKLFP